jgi:hypothetical protein
VGHTNTGVCVSARTMHAVQKRMHAGKKIGRGRAD